IKVLRAQEEIESEKQMRKEIKCVVDRRCERIDEEIRKMLTSLLDKPTNKIRIDRVLEQDSSSWNLANKPKLVLEKTRAHFCEQFREREVILDEKVLEEFYKPLKEVKGEWYDGLDGEISVKEWMSTIEEMKSNTVAGISGIGYVLIKNIQDDAELGYKVRYEKLLDIRTNSVKIAGSKKQMEKLIQISQRFFKFNNIHINSKKSKLLVLNTSIQKEKRYIIKDKERIQAENKKSLVRLLGIWLSSGTNERQLEKKAKLLGHEVLSQQVVSLQNRLNSSDQIGELTRIRVKQGYALAGLVAEQWEDSRNRCLQKIWKNNLACQILVKAKEIGISIRIEEGSWSIPGFGPTIEEVVGKRIFAKAYKGIKEYNLYFVNQLIEENGISMLSWNKFRALRAISSHSHKAKWFEKVEKRIIKNQCTRIKEEKVESWKSNEDKENRAPGVVETLFLRKDQDRVKREKLIGVIPKMGIQQRKKVPVITKEIVGFNTEKRREEVYELESRMEEFLVMKNV
ncbi:46497_t:CDS:2, partial [Gigaspora margarita]